MNASSYSGGEKNNTIGTLSVSIHVGKNTLHPGDKQTITLKVSDPNTSNAIAGAKVTGSIMDPSGSSKNLDGVTDTSGETSYSWTVGHKDTIGMYKVDVQVSASGYEKDTASKSFKVISIPVSSSTNNSDNNNSVQSNNHSQNHPLSIISIPNIRIPFHLPFQ